MLDYRFLATGALPDLDRAIELLDEVERAPDKPWQLRGADSRQLRGVLYRQRYLRTRDRRDIDTAVELLAADAELSPDQPVDRAAWRSIHEALEKINKGQKPIIAALVERLAAQVKQTSTSRY